MRYSICQDRVDGGQKPYPGDYMDQGAGIVSPRVEGYEDPQPGSVLALKEQSRVTATSGTGFRVPTGGLDRSTSCGGEHEVCSLLSDDELYVAVTTAWYRMFLCAERREHPLGPYVFGDGFARSVAVAPIEALRVVAVCARVACRRACGDRESWPAELWAREALDPVAGWWCAIDEPDGLGVHHIELDGSTLEFLSVAYLDDRPNLESFQ